jgi:hypothetical protein
VRFHTVAAVGLKCALGHENALLFPLKNLRFDSISEYIASWARNPARAIAEFRIAVSDHSTCADEPDAIGALHRIESLVLANFPVTLVTFVQTFTINGATLQSDEKFC